MDEDERRAGRGSNTTRHHDVDGDQHGDHGQARRGTPPASAPAREPARQVAVAAERGAELGECRQVDVEHAEGDDGRDDRDDDRADARAA